MAISVKVYLAMLYNGTIELAQTLVEGHIFFIFHIKMSVVLLIDDNKKKNKKK